MRKVLSFDIGLKTMSYAFILVHDGVPHIERTGTFDISKGPPLRLSIEYLVRFLNQPENKWMIQEPDTVLLELQLRANAQMQTIASALHSSMYAYSIVTRREPLKFAYINSSAKFKTFGPVVAPPGATKSQYTRLTKQRAIAIAQEMMQKWAQLDVLERYTASGTSRDIADAVGNGAAFLVKERLYAYA
jgi:hypothetical protein